MSSSDQPGPPPAASVRKADAACPAPLRFRPTHVKSEKEESTTKAQRAEEPQPASTLGPANQKNNHDTPPRTSNASHKNEHSPKESDVTSPKSTSTGSEPYGGVPEEATVAPQITRAPPRPTAAAAAVPSQSLNSPIRRARKEMSLEMEEIAQEGSMDDDDDDGPDRASAHVTSTVPPTQRLHRHVDTSENLTDDTLRLNDGEDHNDVANHSSPLPATMMSPHGDNHRRTVSFSTPQASPRLHANDGHSDETPRQDSGSPLGISARTREKRPSPLQIAAFPSPPSTSLEAKDKQHAHTAAGGSSDSSELPHARTLSLQLTGCNSPAATNLRNRARNAFISPGGGLGASMDGSPGGLSALDSSCAISRQQTTTSPMTYEETDLFKERPEAMEDNAVKSRHKGVAHTVRQTRNALRKPVFDTPFLPLRINDEVIFNWVGSTYHILEVDRSYKHIVPGGCHSVVLQEELEDQARACHMPAPAPMSAFDTGLRSHVVSRQVTEMEGNQLSHRTSLEASRTNASPVADENASPGMRRSASGVLTQRSFMTENTRDEIGEFRVMFTAPGDYYFLCTRHKKWMRVHIQVRDEKSRMKFYIGMTAMTAFIMIAIIFVCAFVIPYKLQDIDMFLKKKNASTEQQYKLIKSLQRILCINVIPWFIVGFLIFIFLLFCGIAYVIHRHCNPKRQGAENRGVSSKVRYIVMSVLLFFCAGNVVLLFITYGLQLSMAQGVDYYADKLCGSLIGITNTLSLALSQATWLVETIPTVFTDLNGQMDGAVTLVHQIYDIVEGARYWISFGQDIAQGAFRALPILLFMSLNIGFFGSAMGIGALTLRYRKPMFAVVWIFAVCIGVYACSCGVVWGEQQLFREVDVFTTSIAENPQGLPGTVGIESSTLSEVFSICNIDNSQIANYTGYVKELLQEVNQSLSPDGQEQFSTIFSFIMDMFPVTAEAFVNFTSYINGNLHALETILNNRGDVINNMTGKNVVSILQVLCSMVSNLQGLINCRVFRDAIVSAQPLLRVYVARYNTALLAFMYILFGLSLPLMIFALATAYAQAYPRKQWYFARTGRWFRFRYSYKVHQRLVMRGQKEETYGRFWIEEVLHPSVPMMFRMINVRLVCFSSSVLMFFDAICLVVYASENKTFRAPLTNTLGYLGCAQLVFLLASFAFRQLWLRYALHGFTLAIVFACFVIGIVQCVLGFVRFADCLESRSAHQVNMSQPYVSTCTVSKAGHEIEVAVYAFIVMLNSVTVGVTLSLLIVYETYITTWLKKRPYWGVLTVFSGIACARRVLRDHLNVHRILLGFLVVVVLVILLVLSLVNVAPMVVPPDASEASQGVGAMVQVIDPTVACNGDPNYCDLRINNYIWACTHNGHSSLEDDFVVPNHYYNISHQLWAGIRNIMIDLWYDYINGTSGEQAIYFCHTVCLAGRRRFRDALIEIKKFMDAYPDQVIMLIIEQYVNSSDIGKVFDEVGLTSYVWYDTQVPPNKNAHYVWPTFQQLIDSGQRVMMYNDEVATEPASIDCPKWLYYSFDYQYENSYQTNAVTQWDCLIERGWCTNPIKDNSTFMYTVNVTGLPVPAGGWCSENATNSTGTNNTTGGGTMEDSSLDELDVHGFADDTLDPAWSDGADSSSDDDGGHHHAVQCTPIPRRMNETAYNLYIVDVTDCRNTSHAEWINGSHVYNTLYHTNPPYVASKMSTVNHYITLGIGSPVSATDANTPAQIRSSAYNCSSQWNQVVNILAFDFWSIENPLGTIEKMNKFIVKYGQTYSYKDAWSMMLFGTATYEIEVPSDY